MTRIMETRNEMPLVANASTHPGAILKDWLEDLGLKQNDFADSIGLPASRLSELIHGKRPMTREVADKLEEVFGVASSFWMKAQAGYEYNERMLALRGREEAAFAAKEESIRSVFNVKELYSRLGISFHRAMDRVSCLLDVLGMSYEEMVGRTAIAGCFKHSDTLGVDERNMRTWVLLAQCSAQKADVSGTYSPRGGRGAAEEIARKANAGDLTEAGIRSILSGSGIAYCVEPKLPRCPVDAYSVMLGGRPAIVVTHRHDDMQKLVFDVLHEIAHIILHMKGDCVDFINADYSQENVCESEANSFARDMLIPPSVWEKITNQAVSLSKEDNIFKAIGRRAESLGVNPRIAVARYKHDTRNYRGKVYASTKIV